MTDDQRSQPTGSRAVAHDSEGAPGVYRFGTNRVNWYVVEANGELTVVDAGLPSHWQQLLDCLDGLGYGLDDVAALVLTHGHGDYIGFANQLQKTADIPVLVHKADEALVEGDGEENMREVVWNLWRPSVIGLLLEFSRSGGTPSPVKTVESFEAGTVLELPTAPQVIHVPGHSAGSCALYLSNRNVLFCGDALATVDLKSGRARGPQIMPMFNENTTKAVESLTQLESLGEVTLLPGHGDPWRGEMQKAIQLARGESE